MVTVTAEARIVDNKNAKILPLFETCPTGTSLGSFTSRRTTEYVTVNFNPNRFIRKATYRPHNIPPATAILRLFVERNWLDHIAQVLFLCWCNATGSHNPFQLKNQWLVIGVGCDCLAEDGFVVVVVAILIWIGWVGQDCWLWGKGLLGLGQGCQGWIVQDCWFWQQKMRGTSSATVQKFPIDTKSGLSGEPLWFCCRSSLASLVPCSILLLSFLSVFGIFNCWMVVHKVSFDLGQGCQGWVSQDWWFGG